MLAALLLTMNLASATPAAAPVAASVSLTQRVLANGDQGVGRGLRNMLVGGVVAGAGVLTSMLSAGVVGLGIGTAVVASQFLGPAIATQIFTVGTLAGAVVFVGAATLLVGGLLWLGVNGMLVLLRLSPGYKPSPATEYLEP